MKEKLQYKSMILQFMKFATDKRMAGGFAQWISNTWNWISIYEQTNERKVGFINLTLIQINQICNKRVENVVFSHIHNKLLGLKYQVCSWAHEQKTYNTLSLYSHKININIFFFHITSRILEIPKKTLQDEKIFRLHNVFQTIINFWWDLDGVDPSIWISIT